MRKNLLLISALAWCALSLSGCSWSFQSWNYRSANKLVEEHKYSEAMKIFTKVIRRKPESWLALEASRKAARLAVFDLKDFKAAVEFYQHLILYSPLSDERLAAQKSLADIYFENLLDFDQAVLEYSRLIKLVPPPQRASYRLTVAKAYFNLNNFAQAEIEVDELLHKPIADDLRFEALLFKGNLLQGAKRLDDAISVFGQILKKYPERARSENVIINLAVCYEEKKEFLKAIEILELAKSTYSSPEFLEVRINRLRERQANLPGAHGVSR